MTCQGKTILSDKNIKKRESTVTLTIQSFKYYLMKRFQVLLQFYPNTQYLTCIKIGAILFFAQF